MHEEFIREIPGSRKAEVMIHGILGMPDHFACYGPDRESLMKDFAELLTDA